MPVDGLSLFGFLPKAMGLGYLASECTGMRSLDRKAAYQAAVAQLGQPFPNAGLPNILAIPAVHQPHLVAVTQDAQFGRTVAGFNAFGWGLVEIDPLIAFQLHLSVERATERSITDTSVGAMLALCLPAASMEVKATWTIGGGPVVGNVTLMSDSLNLTALGPPSIPSKGLVDPAAEIGPILGVASDLVHVFQVAGRFYLRNGYHRAWALRKAGVTHMPALILQASSYAQGQVPAGHFPEPIVTGPNPPTIGHFTQGRAYALKLRRARRRVRITWKIDVERE
jgi:hypothetical protein